MKGFIVEKISREDAKKLDLMFYYTGKLCKHGHDSVRMVKGLACRECKLLEGQKFREQNREKYNKYCREVNKKRYTTENRRKQYQKNIAASLFCAAKNRAKNKNIPFTIEKEDVIITEVCPILGIPFSFGNENGPSLDRKDNSLGYVKGNVFVISKRANRLKADASIDEIQKILDYMKAR